MGWTNTNIDELLLPSDAVIPGDDAWFFTTNVPPELAAEGINAVILGYLRTYDPALAPAATQTVYNFIAIFAPGPGYKGILMGYVVESAGVRAPVYQISQFYNDSTDLSSLILSAYGNINPPTVSDVHFKGAVWNSNNSELLTPAGSALPGDRGYGAWRSCTLQNGWTNSTPTISVLMTASGTVHLRGLIVPGTTVDGTIVATVPADLSGANSYRPTSDVSWIGRSGNAAGLCGITLTSTGNITIRTTTGGAPAAFLWVTGSWVPF